MKCEGSCEEHIGEVIQVKVKSITHDWGDFWYCEVARQEDQQRGLSVEILL